MLEDISINNFNDTVDDNIEILQKITLKEISNWSLSWL